MDKPINKQSYIKSALIFVALIFATFYLLLRGVDFANLAHTLRRVNLLYVACGVVCAFVFIAAEGENIYKMTTTLGTKARRLNCLKYAFAGFFFSAITPSSTGGQPMQMYYMKKDGVPLSHSSLVMLLELASYQFITICMTMSALIYNFDFLMHTPFLIKVLIICSITINALMLTFILFCVFSNKLVTKLITALFALLDKLSFINIKDKTKEMVFAQVEEYRRGALLLRKHPMMFVRVNLVTVVQVTAFYSVAYCVYRAFGLSTMSYLQIVSLQALLTSAVAGMPLPGAVGAAENGFKMIYGGIYPHVLLNSAMLLSRGISFYLYVLISGTMIVVMSRRREKKRG